MSLCRMRNEKEENFRKLNLLYEITLRFDVVIQLLLLKHIYILYLHDLMKYFYQRQAGLILQYQCLKALFNLIQESVCTSEDVSSTPAELKRKKERKDTLSHHDATRLG